MSHPTTPHRPGDHRRPLPANHCETADAAAAPRSPYAARPSDVTGPGDVTGAADRLDKLAAELRRDAARDAGAFVARSDTQQYGE